MQRRKKCLVKNRNEQDLQCIYSQYFVISDPSEKVLNTRVAFRENVSKTGKNHRMTRRKKRKKNREKKRAEGKIIGVPSGISKF